MSDFQHYYYLRQAGYDPREVGSGFLRSIRSALKDYLKRISAVPGEPNVLKSIVQDTYSTLSLAHDMGTLVQKVDKHIDQLEKNSNNDSMLLNIIQMLKELRNHITETN